jgi:hypothetical protein
LFALIARRVALAFLGAKDYLHVVHVVSPDTNENNAQQLISGFSHVMMDGQIERKLTRQVRALVTRDRKHR